MRERSFMVGDWLVEPELGLLSRSGMTAHLEPRAMALLVHLAGATGRLVSKEELVRCVWRGRPVGDDTIASTVSRLRRALGSDGRALLKTVSRKGYTLVARSPNEPVPCSGDAQSLCNRGLMALRVDTRDSRHQARIYFEAALEREADMPLALAGLASVRLSTAFAGMARGRGALVEACTVAARAVRLDGRSALGWAALAFATFLDTRDGIRAEQDFGNGFANTDLDAVVYRWRAFVSAARRRFDEAEHFARTAVLADPHLLSARSTLVQVLLCARRYDAARAEALSILARAPHERAVWLWLGWCEMFSGRPEEAAVAFARSFGGDTNAAAVLRTADLGAFFASLAQQSAEDETPGAVFRPVDRAIVCAHGGEGDRAMRFLAHAVRENDPQLAWVSVLPHFDRLRGRKDFERFCRETRAT